MERVGRAAKNGQAVEIALRRKGLWDNGQQRFFGVDTQILDVSPTFDRRGIMYLFGPGLLPSLKRGESSAGGRRGSPNGNISYSRQ